MLLSSQVLGVSRERHPNIPGCADGTLGALRPRSIQSRSSTMLGMVAKSYELLLRIIPTQHGRHKVTTMQDSLNPILFSQGAPPCSKACRISMPGNGMLAYTTTFHSWREAVVDLAPRLDGTSRHDAFAQRDVRQYLADLSGGEGRGRMLRQENT